MSSRSRHFIAVALFSCDYRQTSEAGEPTPAEAFNAASSNRSPPRQSNRPPPHNTATANSPQAAQSQGKSHHQHRGKSIANRSWLIISLFGIPCHTQ